MKNFGEILKKAQEMQQKMADMQGKLATTEVTGSAGAGMVQVLMTGAGNVLKVTIDPSVTDDLSILEDLLVAAFNDARQKTDELVKKQTADMQSGLKLPFNLPF